METIAATPASTSKPDCVHYASLFPGKERAIDPIFAESVLALEQTLGQPLWLLVQDGKGVTGILSDAVQELFLRSRNELPKGEKVALLVQSPGGSGSAAYRIAKLLRSRCEGFTAVIPRSAWSAATILALGADRILMGTRGNLGPIDVQIVEEGQRISALDEVSALQEIYKATLQSVFTAVSFLAEGGALKKRIDMVGFLERSVNEIMKSAIQRIDMVRLAKMKRSLREGEYYAARLLKRALVKTAAIAAQELCRDYPSHDFVIDSDEAKSIGLKVESLTEQQEAIVDVLSPYLEGESRVLTALGRVVRVPKGTALMKESQATDPKIEPSES